MFSASCPGCTVKFATKTQILLLSKLRSFVMINFYLYRGIVFPRSLEVDVISQLVNEWASKTAKARISSLARAL